MKKLSKIFAVVLVLAMALSMLPMGAGAIDATAGATANLVTDVSTLAVGDQIVIVAKNADYVLSTTQNNNNRGAAAVTKSGNMVTLTADAEVLTLKAGTSDGSFAFAVTDSTYLYAASTSSNHLKTGTLGAYGSFTIAIANGVATIKSVGNTSRGMMCYNPNGGSPLFSCYAETTSSDPELQIYKLTSAAQDTREDLPTTSGAIVDAIFGLEAGKSLSDLYKYDGKITLTGVVSGDASWSDKYSNGTVNFNVKNSAGEDKLMQAYKLVAGANTTVDDIKGLKTGDTVTISGSVVKNFNGVYEFDSCELVSFEKGQVVLPALPTDTADIVDAIYALKAGEALNAYYTYESFTLSGTIVGETSWSDDYSNGELTIKVDGTDKELLAFRFKAGEIDVDTIKALVEGDKVTFTVTSAKNYSGTFEMEYPVLTAVEKGDPDKVGDDTAIVAMTSMMVVALVAMAVLVVGKKRMF